MTITTKILSLALIGMLAFAANAEAVTKTSTAPKPSVDSENANVGTDFKFNDLTVRGQYQSANEGLVTVENDKELTNLLDYRSDYKDRLKASRLNP